MNSEDFNVLPLDALAESIGSPVEDTDPEITFDESTFDDLWDDTPKATEPAPEPEIIATIEPISPMKSEIQKEIEELLNRKQSLKAEVEALQLEKERLINNELVDIKAHIDKMLQEGLKELEQRKQSLEISLEQLEKRRERIKQEMRTTFAGASQDLAVRVQGFKDYLVGSLQDLAAAAEQLELGGLGNTPEQTPNPRGETNYSRSYREEEPVKPSRNPYESNPSRSYRNEEPVKPRNTYESGSYRGEETNKSRNSYESRPSYRDEGTNKPRNSYESGSYRNEERTKPRDTYESRSYREGGRSDNNAPKQGFQDQNQRIQSLLDKYRDRPDYYGPPWQLRRTFEPIHAERVQQWFFKQGGRGAIRSMGSRLQNILVASAIVSVLSELQGDKFRALVLANSPERLGEWRRGLQDCLGISRADFGPDRGVVLFESPEALIQKADRLVEDRLSPLIIIDDTEERLNFALLQFPYWLAFAPEPQQSSSNWY